MFPSNVVGYLRVIGYLHLYSFFQLLVEIVFGEQCVYGINAAHLLGEVDILYGVETVGEAREVGVCLEKIWVGECHCSEHYRQCLCECVAGGHKRVCHLVANGDKHVRVAVHACLVDEPSCFLHFFVVSPFVAVEIVVGDVGVYPLAF